jgi:hypothetical protein
MHPQALIALLLTLATAAHAQPFNSGSSGADGAFNPTVDVTLDVPANGVFNFTSITVPTGVTVRFRCHPSNAPVMMLATSDVVIAGTIDVSGGHAPPSGTAGDGNPADDGTPGSAGCGGYPGGRGADPFFSRFGQAGLGPGGRAGDAGFGILGYGLPELRPLVGGSGGPGADSSVVRTAGGGGGGGAIAIASSTRIQLTGRVQAYGGDGGAMQLFGGAAEQGFPGTGGAIRLVAPRVEGTGQLLAEAGRFHSNLGVLTTTRNTQGIGRIRIDTSVLTFMGTSSPVATVGVPTSVLLSSPPEIRVISVNGIAVSENPDEPIQIAPANNLVVGLQTTNMPAGSVINVVANYSNTSVLRGGSSLPTGPDGSTTATFSNDPAQTGPFTILATSTFVAPSP